jgi:hypothetical protein
MSMRRAGRTLIATVLCGSLAALTASPIALAQDRGNSGLPASAGSPTANLQRQINSLEEQMESLNMQFEVLSSQMGQGSDRKLAVYDAIEQKVGDVIGVELNVPWVSLKANNRTFVLQVTPQQLVGQFLWFGDSVCMGPQVYIAGMTLSPTARAGGANVFALAAVHGDGTVYVAEPNTPPMLKQPVGSVMDANGRCTAVVGTQTVVPASPLPLNLNSVYQRPFTVR